MQRAVGCMFSSHAEKCEFGGMQLNSFHGRYSKQLSCVGGVLVLRGESGGWGHEFAVEIHVGLGYSHSCTR